MAKTWYLAFADEEFKPNTLDKRKVMEVANLSDGWCKSRNCQFEYTNDKAKANAILHVWSNARITKHFPKMSGFSVTRFIEPPRIYFNLDNIKKPPKSYTGTKHDYLNYVIQHELGHAIFKIMTHKHESDVGIDGACNVMYQQTKGTQHCRPDYTFYE